MAERRREGFKQTLTGSATERRRDAAERFRRDKREKAMQQKRRKIVEGWEDRSPEETGMEAPSSTEWTVEGVQATIAAFRQAVTAGAGPALLETTKELRKVLCLSEPPTEMVLAAGVMAQFNSLVSAAELGDDVKLEVLWCLTNIAAGTHEDTRAVLEAAPYLITFVLPCRSEALIEQACWVLGNIAADGPELRTVLQANGAIPALVAVLRDASKLTVKSTAAWTLSHMAKGGGVSGRPFVEAGLLPILAAVLQDHSADESVLKEVAWITAFLTSREDDVVAAILQLGIADSLMRILSAVSQGRMALTVGTPALRGLANIVAGADATMTESLIRQGTLLPSLRALLANPEVSHVRALVKEALWTVANLATTQSAAILSSDIISNVIAYFQSGQFDMQREALFAIHNLVACSPATLQTLIQSHPVVLATLLNMLKAADEEVIGCSLALVELVIRQVPDGAHRVMDLDAEVIENLQYGPHDEKIKAHAARITDLLYEEDEEDDFREEAPGGGGGGGQQLLGGFTFGGASEGAGRGRGRHLNVPAWQTANWGASSHAS